MSFFDRAKMAMAVLRGLPPIDLPASGRSSDESMSSMSAYLSGFGSVSPVIDFEQLKTLKCFWIHNPDFSQYVANIVNLGNPGHSLTVDASNDGRAEAAVNRLNETAARIYAHGGTDGLIDQYLTSLSWSGAISSEDVVNVSARRVEKVVIVPVEQIRFKYNKDNDTYEAYQKSSNFLRRDGGRDPMGLIKLNPETYHYAAFLTVENSPYAKPPATAAIEPIIDGQKPIMENLRWVAKKYGILGLVAVGVAPIRQRGGEQDHEYAKRFEGHIKNYAESLSGNFNKGLIVLPKPNTIDTTTLATNGGGFAELNTVNEQQVFSAMGAQPGFHGRTDSTTETFADVVYYLLTAQVHKLQRVAKRRMEQTYRLDMRLAGMEVDGISLQFNKAHSRNAKDEAETEEIHQRVVLQKVEKGIISPDEGAQELGLDTWFDVELLAGPQPLKSEKLMARLYGDRDTTLTRRSLTVGFDQKRQKYVYQPDVIQLAGGDMADELADDTVVPFIKKKTVGA